MQLLLKLFILKRLSVQTRARADRDLSVPVSHVYDLQIIFYTLTYLDVDGSTINTILLYTRANPLSTVAFAESVDDLQSVAAVIEYR